LTPVKVILVPYSILVTSCPRVSLTPILIVCVFKGTVSQDGFGF
jgi:hypothetical protein